MLLTLWMSVFISPVSLTRCLNSRNFGYIGDDDGELRV